MAEIFRGKALDAHGIEKPVVIKRILPHIAASPEFVEMLIDEAKIAVLLSHGNIAQIYDLGKVAGDYFIVMEYVHGKTLSQVMKRLRTLNRQMPIAYALWICSEVAKGLDYMHRKTDDQGHPLAIVHRDISPQNVIVSTSGTVKIIDFGIAKAKTKVSTTDSGVLKGKFAYMSPEHVEGERLDHRSDIFSLGIILYELLTGQRLFKGRNNPETVRRVKKCRVPLPSSVRSRIPAELDRILLKTLQKNRESRYFSAEELSRDLVRHLVTDYPQFSPQEVIRYLGELFPEIAPTIPDEVKQTPTETKKSGEIVEGQERTAYASPESVREKMEAEVSVPVPELEVKPRKPLLHRLQPLIRPTLILSSLVLLTWMAVKAAPRVTSYTQSLWVKVQSLAIKKEAAIPVETPEAPSPSTPIEVKQGILELSSQPSGARIFLNDQETEWKTPARLPLRSDRETKIGLYLDRYRFWEERIRMKEGTTRLNATLELNYGDLEINSIPAGASVYLNGREVGITPFHRTTIEPETTYELRLKREGYEDWTRPIKVFGGKKEVVNVSLKKLPKSKSLR